jgi:hypothetical protein
MNNGRCFEYNCFPLYSMAFYCFQYDLQYDNDRKYQLIYIDLRLIAHYKLSFPVLWLFFHFGVNSISNNAKFRFLF